MYPLSGKKYPGSETKGKGREEIKRHPVTECNSSKKVVFGTFFFPRIHLSTPGVNLSTLRIYPILPQDTSASRIPASAYRWDNPTAAREDVNDQPPRRRAGFRTIGRGNAIMREDNEQPVAPREDISDWPLRRRGGFGSVKKDEGFGRDSWVPRQRESGWEGKVPRSQWWAEVAPVRRDDRPAPRKFEEV